MVARMNGARVRKVRQALEERDGLACRGCGTTSRRLTIDHVIPRALGGTNRLRNLQFLCFRCNQKKSCTLPPGVVLTPAPEPVTL